MSMLRKIRRNVLKNELEINSIQNVWHNQQIEKYGIKKLKVMNFRCNAFKEFYLKQSPGIARTRNFN